MFIKLHFYNDDTKVMVNVDSIQYLFENGSNTRIRLKDGAYLVVNETPEQIETLIEEALEQRVTNVDNLLGITYHNYQYGRD